MHHALTLIGSNAIVNRWYRIHTLSIFVFQVCFLTFHCLELFFLCSCKIQGQQHGETLSWQAQPEIAYGYHQQSLLRWCYTETERPVVVASIGSSRNRWYRRSDFFRFLFTVAQRIASWRSWRLQVGEKGLSNLFMESL